MTDPDWYPAWRAEALDELSAKCEAMARDFRIAEWDRYDYDFDAGTLTFSLGDTPKVQAEVQIVGTASLAAGSWMWAWANETAPDALVEDALAAQRFGQENGIEELRVPVVESDDLIALGWALTAATARLSGALGAYCSGEADMPIFTVIRDIGYVS